MAHDDASLGLGNHQQADIGEGAWRARPGNPLRGRVTAPGDKSISHRALLLGALAHGSTRIVGLLESADVLRMAEAASALGAKVVRDEPSVWSVIGKGRFIEPADVVDCGNSGTAARLLLGAVAGFPIRVFLSGDSSLRGRPMRRVLAPLHQMGASWLAREGERLPVAIHGGALVGIHHRPEQASAQVKSALLLAGLSARGTTTVLEPLPTRDHTESLLRAFGAPIEVRDTADGREVAIQGGAGLTGTPIHIPGDPSSAAFPLVAALITPGSDVTVTGVLLNPLRVGLLDTLADMQADVVVSRRRRVGGEEIGDVRAKFSSLVGTEVPLTRVVAMIDEMPILAVAAAFARGRTIVAGASELRVKESDRIAAIGSLLRAAGGAVEVREDGFVVAGRAAGSPAPLGGGRVCARGDHRIAMSAMVMGLATERPLEVDDGATIATSFPGFGTLMRSLGADIDRVPADGSPA